MLPVNIERTLPSYASDTKPSDGSWQIVNGTRFKFFVFSAFYDRRAGKLIRIIGATKTRVPEKVWCRFVYNTGNATAPSYRSVSVMARVKVRIYMKWHVSSLIHVIFLSARRCLSCRRDLYLIFIPFRFNRIVSFRFVCFSFPIYFSF